MGYPDPIHDFSRLMERPDEQIRLDEAAFAIARTEYPQLDVASQVERLDALAARVKCDPGHSPHKNIEELNDLLFRQESFCGNEEEYDDPRNSYLNDVLDRKKGIPITLSLVYTEVARRRGLPVVGVGFPGHFLVKYLAESMEILVDPFNLGVLVTRDECEKRLKAHFGEGAELKPEYLAASTHKQILARMLNNLKGSYFRRRAFIKVLAMIELGLAVDPNSRQEIHDRGMVNFLMRRYREAAADFRTYIAIAPRDDPQTKEAQAMLHRLRALWN
jgi:regulator of sirC expression with transglutaminase-like and TPR domain